MALLLLFCCPDCRTGDIRLSGGRDSLEGRVEVCYAGVWGTVCSNAWDIRDATVVCRQLQDPSSGIVDGIFGGFHQICLTTNHLAPQLMYISQKFRHKIPAADLTSFYSHNLLFFACLCFEVRN